MGLGLGEFVSESKQDSRTVLGACPHDCPDTCAMLVNVVGDRVISVQGRADHPFTKGRLCAKTNHFEERVYHPERVLYPLQRTGAKGAATFERITWDTALREIGSRWASMIAQHGPTCILPYSYLGHEGLLNGLNVGDPFFNKLGATVSERTFCDSGASVAYAMTLGPTPGMDPESFAHSKYIILWACNMLSTNAHMWPFVQEAQRRGAKVVVIDPLRTKVAKLANWHLPIRPGTDGALALGMMHIVIRDDLIDRDYVTRYTVGFEELTERTREFTPEHVAHITGLGTADIVTLAREYAQHQPSAIRIGVGIERAAGGGQLVRALCCLPALVGAWRKPGGGILQMPLAAFPVKWDRLMRGDLIPPGTRVLNQWELGRTLTGGLRLDPPIKSLFVYNSNPLVVAPDQQRLRQGLMREDLFTVVSEHFITDTARYADIVLPAATQVEQDDLIVSWGHLYLTMNNKAIEPVGESVSNTELFRRLARTMEFADPFFYRDDEQLLRDTMDWSHPAMQGITLERLRADGYARLNLPPPDQFAPHAEGNFPTPSGKVELKSSLALQGNFVLTVYRQGSNEHQDGSVVDPLPRFVPPRESPLTNPDLAARYPLSMLSPKSHAFLNSEYANFRRQLAQQGSQHLIMHPADAAARSIVDGAKVTVENDRGRFLAAARVSDDIRPGVVVAPLGYWAALSEGEATPAALNPTAYADLGRAPTFSDNLVEVRLADA